MNAVALVSVLAFVATEVLAVKNMTAGGGAREWGLNREILATSPALFLHLLRAKRRLGSPGSRSPPAP